MNNADVAPRTMDPTLGGILGDGTARIRRLVCKTTRMQHSHPDGIRDRDASIHDQFEITFDIASESDSWLPIRVSLRQSCDQGSPVIVESFLCGTQELITPLTGTDCRPQICLPVLDDPHASSFSTPPLGASEPILKMRTWFLSHILLICKTHGAELGARALVGAVKDTARAEPQTLQLCAPRQCHYVPWWCVLSPRFKPHSFEVANPLQRLAELPTPSDALNFIYH